MRSIIIPLIAAGSIAGLAEASSGVRVHRLGDPPLPPRYMDTTPSSYYKKRATTPERLVKPVQTPSTSVVNGGARATKRLPLAPGGFVPAPKPVAPAAAPVPTQVVVAPPAPAPTPAAAGVVSRPVSRYSRANVPAVVATPAPAPAPVPTARRTRLPLAPTSLPAPAPKPTTQVVVKQAPVVVTPAPAPKPAVAPAKQPVAKPAAAPAPAPAPAAKPRRRLPIAPVVVADGSTDLPPVPEALIRR